MHKLFIWVAHPSLLMHYFIAQGCAYFRSGRATLSL